MNYMQKSGARIREAREALGLSRPELAARIEGLEASTLGNWEQGIRYPNDMNWFQLLSEQLGEPASYLAAIDDDESLTNLIRIFSRMDRRGRETMSRIAEAQSGWLPDNGDDEVA